MIDIPGLGRGMLGFMALNSGSHDAGRAHRDGLATHGDGMGFQWKGVG